MATTESNALEIAALKTQLAELLSKSKLPSELTSAQRKSIEDSIHPIINGYRAWKGTSNSNYAAWEVGDTLFNIDNNGKLQILGYVIGVPFDPATDLNNTSKFDKYQSNKPAF